MPYTALAVLIAAIIVSLGIFSLSFTLARGFRKMSDALTDATTALDAAVAKIVTDVSAGLTDIANSISEHVANGTATAAILAEVDKLNALDTSVLASEAPPAVTPPAGDDSVGAPTGGNAVAAPSGDDSVSG